MEGKNLKKVITYPFKPISNKDQDLHIISITERIQKGRETVLRPHRTDFYIVLLITKGNGIHIVDFEKIKLKVNDILIICPNQVHCFQPNKIYDGILIAFTETFYATSTHNKNFLSHADMFNVLSGTSKLEASDEETAVFLQLVNSLNTELNQNYDHLQTAVLHNYLSNLLYYVERSLIQPDNQKLLNKDYSYTVAFRRLVQYKLAQHITVNDYAKELFISSRRLQKAIEATLGKSPKTYIGEQLVLEGKRLLVHEASSIKEISYSLGFDEPTNFTKFFKKQTGLSPSEFKEMQQT